MKVIILLLTVVMLALIGLNFFVTSPYLITAIGVLFFIITILTALVKISSNNNSDNDKNEK